ncbi:Outward-rectifier potassium channel TOK1 [Smittium culicis]|uniref:Outward-rectifier potassium channel TOK1 n=1 Tax=Smittium culicis TaxID=133412 RepID=A0A1R1YDV6_9FUNG|nr:Outward-rectifier potassium channel TOK1 [Smittium culicis]
MMFLEKFPFYKGLYLSFVTVTTIGFGDYYPTSNLSRSVTICWFFIGIVLLGLYLLNTRNVVIQLMSERYHRQLVKLTQKKNEFDKTAVKKYKMMELQARQSNSLKSKVYKWYLRKGISKKKLKDFEVPKWMKNSQSFFRSKTRESESEKKRKISLYNRTKTKLNRRLFFISTFNIIMWFVLAGIFYSLESHQWDYMDSLWFCFVAFTTLGYGDVSPKTKSGITFFDFIVITAVSCYTAFLVISVERFQFALQHYLKSEHKYEEQYNYSIFRTKLFQLDHRKLKLPLSHSRGSSTAFSERKVNINDDSHIIEVVPSSKIWPKAEYWKKKTL